MADGVVCDARQQFPNTNHECLCQSPFPHRPHACWCGRTWLHAPAEPNRPEMTLMRMSSGDAFGPRVAHDDEADEGTDYEVWINGGAFKKTIHDVEEVVFTATHVVFVREEVAVWAVLASKVDELVTLGQRELFNRGSS